jgi:uncharacterized SAM-binding protein YcdF (DUF218 family)
MFFLVSKILSFLTTPLMWVVAMLGFAVFTKNVVRKKTLLVCSFCSLLIFSNPYIFGLFNNAWEVPCVTRNNMKTYDIGIVLSGMIAYDEDIDRVLFNSNVNRLTQAIELYKKGFIKKIFISGGSGSITYPEKSEAAILKRYLVNIIGIPETDVYTETISNNTHENAKFTKEKISELGFSKSKLLLITSGLHMRRAKGCFEKVGLKVDLYSPGRNNEREQFIPSKIIIPQAEVLFYWNSFFHEVIGVLTYKVTGYI